MSNSENFVTGTTVTHGWLNDVNTVVYEALGGNSHVPTTPAEVVAALGIPGALDLSNNTDPTKGAGLVGYGDSLGYNVGTVGDALKNPNSAPGVPYVIGAGGNPNRLVIDPTSGLVTLEQGLDVFGTSDFNGAVVVSTTGSTDSILVSDTGGAGANIKLSGNGGSTPSKTIRATAGDFQIVNDAYSLALMSIDDAGNTSIAGAIAAPSIAFAGGTPLAHYVEGTFTPSATFGGAAVGLSLAGSTTGFYTRVGRVVTFSLIVNFTSKGSSAGVFVLTGLPFAGNSGINQNVVITMANTTNSITVPVGAYVQFNSTTVTIGTFQTNSSFTQFTDADVQNNSSFSVTGSYMTN